MQQRWPHYDGWINQLVTPSLFNVRSIDQNGQTAMWNLTANDVQRAKEELKGRRAAIQARYENELKQLEVDIGDLETFERFAVKFVADFKGEEAPVAPAVEAVTMAAEAAAEPPAAAPDTAPNPEIVEASSDNVAPMPSADSGPRKGTSRWRMHLGTGEASA
jgi:hypothetical protein